MLAATHVGVLRPDRPIASPRKGDPDDPHRQRSDLAEDKLPLDSAGAMVDEAKISLRPSTDTRTILKPAAP